MALIDCPDCGKQVSSAAVSCPKCAYPIADSISTGKGRFGEPARAAGVDLSEFKGPTPLPPLSEGESKSELRKQTNKRDWRLLAAIVILFLVAGAIFDRCGRDAVEPVATVEPGSQSSGWVKGGNRPSSKMGAAPASGNDYTREEYLAIREAGELFLDTMAPNLRGLSGSDFRTVGAAGGWDCSDRSAADMQAQCKLVAPTAIFWLEGWYRRGTRRVTAVHITVLHPAGEAFEHVARGRYGEPTPGKGAGVSVWKLRSNTAVGYHKYRNIHYLTYGHPKSPHVVGSP